MQEKNLSIPWFSQDEANLFRALKTFTTTVNYTWKHIPIII